MFVTIKVHVMLRNSIVLAWMCDNRELVQHEMTQINVA